MNKNILQTLLGVTIGGVFLFLTLKNKPLDEIWQSISAANWWWVSLSGFALIMVFLLRALRWRLLIQNVGYDPKKRHVVYALIMGYFVNSFTPKLGEIVRCTSLKTKSDVPVAHSLGTVVSERVYDIMIMFAGLFVIFALEVDRLGHIMSGMFEVVASKFSDNLIVSISVLVLLAAMGYALLHFLTKKGLFVRITGFVNDMLKTVRSTFRIKRYRGFLLYTLLIWIALVLMNYCFLKALPETHNHNFYFAVVVLFVGSIGWAMPTPGGIGTTHFVILQLFLAFSLTESAGISFGVLSNGLTFVYTLVFGFIALFLNSLKSVFK